MPRYWLLKSEPEAYSFEQLEADGTTPWTGVRNFQARNNMMEMRVGDLALFYHSSIAEPAAVGVCTVVREAYPDFTQFDAASEYYDPNSRPERPKWRMVDVEFVRKLPRFVPLDELRAMPELAGMPLLRRGQRLSVQPVEERYWNAILRAAEAEVTR